MTIKPRSSQKWPLLAGQGVALLQAIDRVGIDSRELMSKAGFMIDAAELSSSSPEEAANPQLVRMVQEAVRLLETTAALEAGHAPPHRYQYELMWFAAAGCDHLANAIGFVELFSEVLAGHMGQIHSMQEGPVAIIVFERGHARRTPPIFLADVLRLVMVDRMLSWLCGKHLPVVSYGLDYPESYAQHLPPGLIARPLAWGHPHMTLRMPAAVREFKVSRSPNELAALFPLSPVLLSDRPDNTYAWRVATQIDAAIGEGRPIPSLIQIAQAEFCSAATLRRRLAAEDTSLQQIKNDRRRAWAVMLLKTRQHSVEQVAEQLDFADEAAFRRAFKQWTGLPPLAYARTT